MAPARDLLLVQLQAELQQRGVASSTELQQTLGRSQTFGTLTHPGGQRVHVQALDLGLDLVSQGELPWFLTTLRLQGFLGRLWARHAAPPGLDTQPERWTLEQQLGLLLMRQVHDLPGAITLGDAPTAPSRGPRLPSLAAPSGATPPGPAGGRGLLAARGGRRHAQPTVPRPGGRDGAAAGPSGLSLRAHLPCATARSRPKSSGTSLPRPMMST